MTFPWPRACSADPVAAGFRAAVDDFVVREELAFTPSGAGEHLYLHLRKRNLATPELADCLARTFRVDGSAVGYAGMKDKRAVTDQWFSIATPEPAEAFPAVPGVTLLGASRHARKLRRGELIGNGFEIRLTGLDDDAWEPRLAQVAAHGAPNYFGPQRFGRDNLAAALAWLPQRRRRRVSRFRQGLHLSVLRSFLFNEVLAARVRAGNWNRAIPGDVLGGDDGQCDPAGPLWGRGSTAAREEALVLEQAALASHAGLLEGLEHAGLRQERRSFVLRPRDMRWERRGSDLLVRFALPAGGYATALLAEVFLLRAPEENG